MSNSTLSKKINTNQKFLNWLYYLTNGYNKEEYDKAIQEENALDSNTVDSTIIKQIKKDVTALNLTVKKSNSFLTLTKNTIISYIIILILFLIILYLHIHVLKKVANLVTKDLFSNRINLMKKTNLQLW
jgi:hypothetical protein